MYISGGSNIYPREVEEKILTHPGIGEVAVLGVPDPFWGEVGVAVCVAREGADAVSEAELAAFLSRRCRATKCQNGSSSGSVCRNPATARFRSGWCATNSRRAGCWIDQARRIAMSVAKPNRSVPRRCATSPSPAAEPERIQWVEARGRAFSFTLEAGLPCWKPHARFCRGRILWWRVEHARRRARPFAYVMPALSKTGANAAFYSDNYGPRASRSSMCGDDAGRTRSCAVLSLPRPVDRDRRPCAWRHILPEESIVAEPFAWKRSG